MVNERLSTLSMRKLQDFSNQLFDEDVKKIIEHTRTIILLNLYDGRVLVCVVKVKLLQATGKV